MAASASVRCGVYFFAPGNITAGAAWPRRNCLERARQSVQSHSPSPSHLYAYSVHSASSPQTAVSRFSCAAGAISLFPRRTQAEKAGRVPLFLRIFKAFPGTHKNTKNMLPRFFPSFSIPFLSTSSPVSLRGCTLCTDIRPALINSPSQHNILYAICAQMPVYQIR